MEQDDISEDEFIMDEDDNVLDEEQDEINISENKTTDIIEVTYLPIGNRRAPSRTSSYEKSKILSVRSSMIQSGTDLYTDTVGPNTLENIEEELKNRMCPIIYERSFTMGKHKFVEKISANELEII